jgi:hypothetical protein
MRLRTSWKLIVFTLLCALVPAIAAAQILPYRANLTGAQEVPPSGSTAVGFGRVTFLSDTTIRVSLQFSGLGSNQTMAHIHGPAAPGASGPIIFDIGSQGATSGLFRNLIFVVTPQQMQDFRNGLWYFNVHSVNFPNGEIRGQIVPDPWFGSRLNSAQQVPPTPSAGSAFVRLTLSETETQIWISVNYTGLTSNQTGLHVHGPAAPGAAGPIILSMASSGNPQGVFTDQVHSVTPVQVAQLKAGQWYFDVHSVNFPDGEIRGQIKAYNKPVDFDADGRAEIGVYRDGGSGIWYTLNHVTNAFNAVAFGTLYDAVTPIDSDSDSRTDLTVWRPDTGVFYTLFSSDGSLQSEQFGQVGDDPRIGGDYTGDGVGDIAVWRAAAPGSQAVFYILDLLLGGFQAVPFGVSGSDVTVTGDYDGDRAADMAVYRLTSGTYYILRSSLGFLGMQFGDANMDALVPGDYDGDGTTDFAVFRYGGSTPGTWYIWQSSTGTLRSEAFGLGTDRPLPADYDGDGKTDLAVTRTAGGAYTWYILQSSNGALKAVGFGADGDFQLPRYLVR